MKPRIDTKSRIQKLEISRLNLKVKSRTKTLQQNMKSRTSDSLCNVFMKSRSQVKFYLLLVKKLGFSLLGEIPCYPVGGMHDEKFEPHIIGMTDFNLLSKK